VTFSVVVFLGVLVAACLGRAAATAWTVRALAAAPRAKPTGKAGRSPWIS
jgi:hypothetical protein